MRSSGGASTPMLHTSDDFMRLLANPHPLAIAGRLAVAPATVAEVATDCALRPRDLAVARTPAGSRWVD
ncbi:MAG: hypothetical protein JF887_13105 [Candidatus Dormibacteraeota bacterium]|uniref:Uncharacterized protein n=1 Tax=Candidatus Amunia macphersoniae TaxID=3127014 RepID=A0A934KR94_9BACT|nr:hypothetical protein [Candidatus Dormibacteraeota bacterium]